MLIQLRLRPFFFLPCIIFLVFSFVFCTALSKEDCFQLLNTYHSRLLDLFFINYTNVGDGITTVALVFIFAMFKKRKEALTLSISYITSGIAAQLLKHLFNE